MNAHPGCTRTDTRTCIEWGESENSFVGWSAMRSPPWSDAFRLAAAAAVGGADQLPIRFMKILEETLAFVGWT